MARSDEETLQLRAVVAGIAVLLALAVAQFSDLLTFVRMVGISGLAAELNPIAARGADQLGIETLAAGKVALVIFVASVFAVVARRHRRMAATVATLGVLAGFVGAFSNVLAVV